jgi:energy-coupling factor transporter ATP-binding protein EcfA2
MNEDTNMIKLPEGKAIVITGPEGSGKSTLARKIAEMTGSYRDVGAGHLKERFGLAKILLPKVDTVIIEEAEINERTRAMYVILASEDEAVIEEKGQEPRKTDLPNFIFITDSKIELPEYDRRFFVIECLP